MSGFISTSTFCSFPSFSVKSAIPERPKVRMLPSFVNMEYFPSGPVRTEEPEVLSVTVTPSSGLAFSSVTMPVKLELSALKACFSILI